MKDPKLIEILKTFNNEEFKKFEKFIASSYFGRGGDLIPFFKILKTFYPDFKNENLN